jgi:1,4-dihydroxy-2-naphthoyl-CoA synthase
MQQAYQDILFEADGPTAVVTINRPHRYNAFTGRTIEELIDAFRRVWADPSLRVAILTGAGDKAFCTGGDVKQRAETGDYGPTRSGMFEGEYKHIFGADSAHQTGLATVAYDGLELFVASPEATEGVTAFLEKRPADFAAPVG